MHVEPTLGAIFRAYGASYLERHGATDRQRAVMRHIQTCRTPALGGHEYECDSCDHTAIAWNSCRDRHCPTCQGREAAEWVDRMRTRLLPTHYFHVVFTIPHELNVLVLLNKKRCYDIQFRAASETLQTILRDPKRLGATPAVTSVLHTWTQRLEYHVHIHCLVSGGGLSPDGTSWISSPRNFLVHVKVLSRMFRGKYLDFLERALADTKDPLTLRGDVAGLADPEEFDCLKRRLYLKKWVVYAKEPLRGPLIGRFLLHTLPRGYTRIRHTGLAAPCHVNTRLPVAREILLKEAAARGEPVAEEKLDPPPDPAVCPKCGGRMLVKRVIEPPHEEPFDTS